MEKHEMKIRLLEKHTHAGRDYDKGAELTMNRKSAEWLVSLKKAEPVSGAVKPTAE